jgi:hypothetical protein
MPMEIICIFGESISRHVRVGAGQAHLLVARCLARLVRSLAAHERLEHDNSTCFMLAGERARRAWDQAMVLETEEV